MKIFYTIFEGERWHEASVNRREFHKKIALNVWYVQETNMTFDAAIRVGNIIYDFVLLNLGYSNWIREYKNLST